MKTTLTAVAIALWCGAAFAQTSMGMPAQEKDPNAVGGKAADKAQMNTDARKAATPDAASTMGAPPPSRRSMRVFNGIDTNGDGVISKEEWDAHNARMWNRMNKNGSIAVRDMEAAMNDGGPN